jgi:hypothetical protein
MKLVMRALIGVVVAVLVFVLVSGSLSAQKAQAQAAKGSSAPVYVAEFTSSIDGLPTKIRGNGGTYPVRIGSTGGFNLTASIAESRLVTFEFSEPSVTFQNPLVCEAGSPPVSYDRTGGYPPYALQGDKIVTPDRTVFQSQYELVYNGKWERILLSQKRNTYKLFDMVGLARGEKAYTTLLTYFQFADPKDGIPSDTYYVNFNDTFYRELLPTGFATKLNGGVVEVEKDVYDEVWYIRPISDHFPVLGGQTIPHYQANHAIYDLPDFHGDAPSGGNCDVGNFLMPFEIKVTRIK